MMDKLTTIQDDDFTTKFLDVVLRHTKGTLEAATGAFASDKKELVLSGGHILQAMLNCNRIQTLKAEWEELKRKGRIKEDYQQTEQHHACLQEMLDFLDNDKPDKTRFDFMKKIFLMAATEEVADRKSVLPQQLMRLCRKLSSGEILVLMATHTCAVKKSFQKTALGLQQWLEVIADISGLKHKELVYLFQVNLEELGILNERLNADKSAVRLTDKNRFTDLGWSICEFIEKYNVSEERVNE